MTKSDFWHILEELGRTMKFGNFQPKSSLKAQTQKRTTVETELPLETKEQWPKLTKIGIKTRFIFKCRHFLAPHVPKWYFLVFGCLQKI